MRPRFFIFLISTLFGPLAWGQNIDSVVLPAKTEIFVTLQRTLNTRTLAAGDRFYGQVSVPVTANDRIIIPVGSSIIGHVDTSRRPGHLKGQGELMLEFDSIILPDGTTREIQAVVQSVENYATSGISSTEGGIVAEGSQGRETAATAAGTAVKGAVVGAIADRSVKGAGIGGLIGAAGGAIIGVFKRGKDVELHKGDSVTIQLTEAVRFVKPQPAPEGERLNSSP
ncbi:MAG: hypothetical protein HYX74_02590 [Acidobacteria bacterium]|nr:hypothetical protein [Acidobacteriota bacterium]